MQVWHEAGDVIQHGHIQDVRGVLAQTTFYVLPSYREGLPRTVLEAMATGRPVITTNVPGCRETVIDRVNGFLVPPRNIEALAMAMTCLIKQPQSETVRMAQASFDIALERFDVHKVNALMLASIGL
jgi:glycosyltransferase involved in cell wall biosynthesis